jgi:hypothetical protein
MMYDADKLRRETGSLLGTRKHDDGNREQKWIFVRLGAKGY